MAKGSCLCGGIAYEVELLPENTFNCHCSFCRKAHGADYATVVFAKGETLKITKGEDLLSEYENALGSLRGFCSKCGSRLMNYAHDKTAYLCIVLASIDTPVEFKPLAHVNLESKAPWHEPDASIPSFQGLPDNIAD